MNNLSKHHIPSKSKIFKNKIILFQSLITFVLSHSLNMKHIFLVWFKMMNPIFNTRNCTEPGEETTFWDNLSYKRLFSWLEPVTRQQDHSHQAQGSLVLHWGTCSSLQPLQACACVCETRARMEWRLRRILASCDRKRERAPRSAALQNKRCKYQFFPIRN